VPGSASGAAPASAVISLCRLIPDVILMESNFLFSLVAGWPIADPAVIHQNESCVADRREIQKRNTREDS
jgi:hypothetical protein